MGHSWDADHLVAQAEPATHFRRNVLQQVVCELRFPTLMELGSPKPPRAFVDALRKDYPHLETNNEVTIGLGVASSLPSHAHVLRSLRRDWSVSIKQSMLTIETSNYVDHADMRKRVLRVVDIASKIIDTDFFTRIGMRYINIVGNGEDPVSGWINEALVAPLQRGQFSGVAEYAGKLLVSSADGGCLLQHGIKPKQATSKKSQDDFIPEYLIDIDSFRNEIEIADTADAIDSINRQAYSMFDWAIGPKTRQFLSE